MSGLITKFETRQHLKKEPVQGPPLVAGGVYRREDPNTGRTIWATITSVTQEPSGVRHAQFCVGGRVERRVHEQDESFAGWTLVGAPRELDVEVGPQGDVEAEDATDSRIAHLEAAVRTLEQEAKEREDVLERVTKAVTVVRLKETGKDWKDISEAVDLPWQTCKALYTQYGG